MFVEGVGAAAQQPESRQQGDRAQRIEYAAGAQRPPYHIVAAESARHAVLVGDISFDQDIMLAAHRQHHRSSDVLDPVDDHDRLAGLGFDPDIFHRRRKKRTAVQDRQQQHAEPCRRMPFSESLHLHPGPCDPSPSITALLYSRRARRTLQPQRRQKSEK
ncbi:hypothetical protein SDC9_149021 [bioreactor metagenome]|uniref:Uncharacterized protein n=1 Tax=bioreactor metagenome TaxID=1076179 RepID=A0A645EL09_9ZZZZ